MLQRKVGRSSLCHVSWFKLMSVVEISNRTGKLYYCYFLNISWNGWGNFGPHLCCLQTRMLTVSTVSWIVLCYAVFLTARPVFLSFLLIELTISFMPLQSFVSIQTCSSPRPLGWTIIYGFPVRSFFVLCTCQEDEQEVQDLQWISYVCSGTK